MAIIIRFTSFRRSQKLNISVQHYIFRQILAKIRHLDKLLTISTFYRNPFPVANRRRFDKAFIRLR